MLQKRVKETLILYDHHTFHNLMLAKAEQSAANMIDHAGKDSMRLKLHFMPPAYWMSIVTIHI
jgi:beta-fructofuranosidase